MNPKDKALAELAQKIEALKAVARAIDEEVERLGRPDWMWRPEPNEPQVDRILKEFEK